LIATTKKNAKAIVLYFYFHLLISIRIPVVIFYVKHADSFSKK